METSVCWPCIQEKSKRESGQNEVREDADSVLSDMANIDVDWDVDGVISPEESVTKMLSVIAKKGKEDSGTFWCWDGRVWTSSSLVFKANYT